MRKYTLLIFMLLASVFAANAQLVVQFEGNDNSDPGETVEIDVLVSDFNNLFGIQYSINWDSLVLSYNSITNVTGNLPGFDVQAVGIPPGSVNVDPGEITVSWFQSSPNSLPDDTRLFTIVFDALSVPCDSTNIVVSDTPLAIEITDENFNEIGVDFMAKTIHINGTDCGGIDPPNMDLTFNVDNDIVPPNVNVCIPVTVLNFDGFNAGQGKFSWDPTVLTFDKVQNVISGSYNDNPTNVANGTYNFLWENLDPANPVVLADGATFMEVCFDVIGNNGDMTTFDMTAFAADWGFTNAAGVEPPLVLDNGVITIGLEQNPVTVNINTATVDEDSEICVPVRVVSFANILSFQGTFAWNDAIIDFDRTEGFGLPGLDANDFNQIENNRLRITWSAPVSQQTDGVSVNNGTTIFEICFTGVGPCLDQGTSQLDFIDHNGFDVEFISIASGAPVTIDDVINPGSVSINACTPNPITCQITDFTDVLCNGQNTGSITANVVNATSDCNCVWYKDGSTTPFQTNPVANCNLTGAGAGMYQLDIMCNGVVECSTSAQEIKQPMAITINGAVTNIGCGQTTGSVTTSVSGGTPNYRYLWDDANMSTTKDIDNLPPGMYTVTVTDDNDCTSTMSFEVTSMTDPLMVAATGNSVNCFGESTGSITVNVTGGCPDGNGAYMIEPSVLTNLGAGMYTVTVTDFSTPPNVEMVTVEITQPAEALSGTIVSIVGSTGMDGSFTLDINGGTSNFGVTWTGPTAILDNELNPTNLALGIYTATITDANGCMTTATDTVPDISNPDAPVISNLTGTDASCNGEEDGAINGSVSAGAIPFLIELLDGSQVVASLNLASTDVFMFSGIFAGDYTVRVTGDNGESTEQSISIGEPTAISLQVDVTCANGSNNDGAIDLTATGGNGDFSYEWSTGAMTEDLDDIVIGNYSVLVEDANSCQAIGNNIRVADCNPTNCYEAIPIITPNGDGINDAFIINCVMQENTRLTIYDRWGREVFTMNNYDNTWSGVDQVGEEVMESAYMWVLEVDFSDTRKEIFKGTVTVLKDN